MKNDRKKIRSDIKNRVDKIENIAALNAQQKTQKVKKLQDEIDKEINKTK